MLHGWLDSWSGLGAIVVGLREHSYELTLIHDKNGWGGDVIHHDQIPSWVGIYPSSIASARGHGPSVRHPPCTALLALSGRHSAVRHPCCRERGETPMNSVRTGTFKSSLLVAIASWVVNDHAWAQTMPSPVMPPATAQPAAEGGGAAIAAVGAVVGLLVVIGIVAKLFDLKQKRESEAVQLQAQLSDALLREPSLAGLPLTPTVHVPMWKGTPATIEMMGRVPTPEAKEAVLRMVRDEAARVRSDVQIEERLSVVPTTARVA